MKQITYQTMGTCSQLMIVSGNEGRIVDVKILGGCNGNLQGISSLVKGMKYEDVIERLEGIRCGNKLTSCPDQLACAVKQLMQSEDA